MSLKISNLSKRIDDQWILRDVSFEAESGKIFGLVGENDLETLTVLQMINDAKISGSGKIFFNGNDLTEKDAAIFPSFEEKNLRGKFFVPKLKTDLTKNEKIKVAFGTLLNTAENILLLDHPFCCLNENLRDELILNLRNAARERNLTVILATNNTDEIFAACNQVGVLKNGEIAQIGTPRELYEKPDSTWVAAALGRCNFIKAMRVSFTNQNSQEFQTLNGEHRLQTDKSEKGILGAINSPVTLAIRPEHISISFGASFPEDNLLKAKIADVRYRGASTGIMLDAGSLMLEALVLRLVGLKVGDECMVGLPPDRILILKD